MLLGGACATEWWCVLSNNWTDSNPDLLNPNTNLTLTLTPTLTTILTLSIRLHHDVCKGKKTHLDYSLITLLLIVLSITNAQTLVHLIWSICDFQNNCFKNVVY